MTNNKGFTLIELMIVVCIIGILAAIATPKLAMAIRHAHESRTMANLKALRTALDMYHAANDGKWPTDDLTCLVPVYLKEIPLKHTPPYHSDGRVIGTGIAADMGASRGDWFYANVAGDIDHGKIWVNCVHETIGGKRWDSL